MSGSIDEPLSAGAESLLLHLAAQEWGGPIHFLPSAAAEQLSSTASEVVDAFLELSTAGYVNVEPGGAMVTIERPGIERIRAVAARHLPDASRTTLVRVLAEQLLVRRLVPPPSA